MERAKSEGGGGVGHGPQSGAALLPLVYSDLIRLATGELSNGWGSLGLEPAELVHEAWLRLGNDPAQLWNHRGHFFAAAAQAMRRILVEGARRAGRQKRGGDCQRVDLERVEALSPCREEPLLALDEALRQLAAVHPSAAELIRLRFYVGLTHSAAAQHLGLSRSGADRAWLFARAWLGHELRPSAAVRLCACPTSRGVGLQPFCRDSLGDAGPFGADQVLVKQPAAGKRT